VSISLLAWLSGLLLLGLASCRRPVYAAGFYLYTFFLIPDYWWWGKAAGLAGYRWSFMSGWFTFFLVLFHNARRGRTVFVTGSPVDLLAVGILLNATLVHLFLAPSWAVSLGPYSLLAKFVLLYFLIRASLWERQDIYRLCAILVLGAGYIGYEVTINDRGHIQKGRLEGVGVPGATGANELGNLLVTVLPLIGTCVIHGPLALRLFALAAAPLVLNVILLVNSRGTFLGLIAAAIVFLPACPPRARRFAAAGLCAGLLALVFLLRDPHIVERFLTTFAPAEERDSSAQERLVLWRAGIAMVLDHPLGSGGYAFKRVRGKDYMPDVGLWYTVRSVHNGYINEACEWGIQGLALKVGFLLYAAAAAWRTSRRVSLAGHVRDGLVGAAVVSGLVGFMVSTTFGDYLDAEWAYWCAAIAIGYSEVYARAKAPSRDGYARGGWQRSSSSAPAQWPAPGWDSRGMARGVP